MNKPIKHAAYAGIFSIVIIFPITFFAVLETYGRLSSTLLTLYAISLLLSLAFSVVNAWGFVIIGKKTKSNTLKNSAYLLIAATLILSFYELASALTGTIENTAIMIFMFILFGIVGIPFGIGLLKLKKPFGNNAVAAGTLWIVASILFFTVHFNLLGSLLLVAATIFEILILFKAAKKY